MIRITSKVDGFRRAGRVHPAAPTEHAADAFTAHQLAALKAEPMLSVEHIDHTAFAEKAATPTKPQSKASAKKAPA